MHESLVRARKSELAGEHGDALSAYNVARKSEDADDRYEGALGVLNLHERGNVETHALKILGVILLLVTLAGGGALIISALPQAGSSLTRAVPLDQIRLTLGVAVVLWGLIFSALLIAAARVVRLLEVMELRQACEREARIRGESGAPALRPSAEIAPGVAATEQA